MDRLPPNQVSVLVARLTVGRRGTYLLNMCAGSRSLREVIADAMWLDMGCFSLYAWKSTEKR